MTRDDIEIATEEEMREEAVARMKLLNMMKNPIDEFKNGTHLNMSENGGILYWLTDEQEEKVKEIEKEHGFVVYHVIHQLTNLGELFSLLMVSRFKEEWKQDRADLQENMTLAYVVNATMPDCSEMGSIGIRPSLGGVWREW